MNRIPYLLICAVLATTTLNGCGEERASIQRPEEIVSLRQVLYDKDTYARLADLWKQYNEVYPSEDAYANWMYAARYAEAANYSSLLEEGVKRYPDNPKLLYLKSMSHHGKAKNLEALSLLERAVELDPSYTDPWFALVISYMERGESEKMNVALRKILESGIIDDEVMDFSYNMLACLEKNAIVVTNGDNDTYPGWILTRIVGYRPDVRLVNQSLLNTDWYPRTLVAEGIPFSLAEGSLDSLSKAVEAEIKRIVETKEPFPEGGLFSSALVERLVDGCGNVGRPVYFASTLQRSPVVKRLLATGRELGLATLVTPTTETAASQVKSAMTTWLQDFRTSGLDGWSFRYDKESRAGRRLAQNYAAALASQMDQIIRFAPEKRLGLFQWYRAHVTNIVPFETRDKVDRMWCQSDDIAEIKEWCRSRNLLK